MIYFIATNGKIYSKTPVNNVLPRLDLESIGLKNEFEHKESARLLRHIINEREPLMFYGKPGSKKGLRADARRDKAAVD